MLCGVVPGSMITDVTGMSGKLLVMSAQLAPLSLVKNTCAVPKVVYTTTTWLVFPGSIAMAATAAAGAVGAFTVTGVHVAAAPFNASAVRCKVPSVNATHTTFESSFEMLSGCPPLFRFCGNVCITLNVLPPSALCKSTLPLLPPPTTYARVPFGSKATLLMLVMLDGMAPEGDGHVALPSGSKP
jgi:hypothetical protein